MLRPEKWSLDDRGPKLLPSLPPSLASSGSRRWSFWVSPSLIGLALGHTLTKFAAKPDNPCSRYVFWSPTVSRVNVSLTLLELLPSHGYFTPPLFRGDFPRLGERKRLNAILRKLTRSCFLPADFPSFDKHCSRADSTLFRSILLNPCHVLHDLLPPRKVTPYNTRLRPHDLPIPRIDAFAKRSFIMRMLYDFA